MNIDTQIACVVRELGMRKKVYTRRVHDNLMHPAQRDHELAAMNSVLETLEWIKRHKEIQALFDSEATSMPEDLALEWRHD